MFPDCIGLYCSRHEMVGSRVTCNPPPTNTDQDVLCFVDGDFGQLLADLEGLGWEFDGNEYYANALADGVGFRSYRNGAVNLILTTDEDFYKRFVAATSIAKHLNLLRKIDRVALFQAVLYGNAYVEQAAANVRKAA